MSQPITPEGRITFISKHKDYVIIAEYTGAWVGMGSLPDSLIL